MKFKFRPDTLVDFVTSVLGDTEIVEKGERFGEAALAALVHAGLPIGECARLVARAKCDDGEVDPVELLNGVRGSAELEAWAKKWAARFRAQKKRPPVGLVREMVRDAVKSRFH